MSPARPACALGWRVHSGWAVFAVVGGSSTAPVLVRRGRMELVDPKEPGSTQPYHAAEGLPLAKAERLLEGYRRSARRLAERGLGEALDELRREGNVVAGCGLLLGSGRSGLPLETVLSSHALIHTADGDHFREALAWACEQRGIAVTGISERELGERASKRLDMRAPQMEARLRDWGRRAGPPWRQDEKRAAVAAWLVLAGG